MGQTKVIYLDNAATTKPLPCAVQAAALAMETAYGNPSAVHSFGKLANGLVEQARERVRCALRAKVGKVIFTSGGTESINWAIQYGALKGKHRGKHIVTTAIEHAAVLETVKSLGQQGYEVTYVQPEKDGMVMVDAVLQAVRSDTVLLSLTWVCNETGAILDIAAMAAGAKKKNPQILVHIDGVQGFLKLPLPNGPYDFISISAHKIGGIKGVGALYVADGIPLKPMLHGGYQDMGLRSGTQNVPAIAAFGAAAQYHKEHEEQPETLYHLRKYCIQRLGELPQAAVVQPQNHAPHIVNVGFAKGKSEVLIRVLSDHGIAVAGGSACARGKKSHVLAAMKLPPKVIDSSLRISLCAQNTKEEIDACVACLQQAMEMF